MTESKLVNSRAKIPKSAVFAQRYFGCKWSDFGQDFRITPYIYYAYSSLFN